LTLLLSLAVEKAIEKSSAVSATAKESAVKHYLEAAEGKSNSEARDIAADILGERIRWDWDSAYTHHIALYIMI
jgi:isocitrate lyase